MSEVNVADVNNVENSVGVVSKVDPVQIQKMVHTGLVFFKLLAARQNWTQIVGWVELVDGFVNDPEILNTILSLFDLFKGVSKEDAKALMEVVKVTLRK